MSKGKFITVEGGEGVGKTTNIEFVRTRLEAAGIDVLVTREPGGTPLGEAIRGLLLDPKYTGMDPEFESDILAPGVDWGGFPNIRIFNVGINLSF